MQIMITGSRGFIGSNIVKQLKDEHTIIGVNQNYDDRCHKSYSVDISSYTEVSKLFSEVSPDIIIHCAAKANPQGDKIPTKIIDVNIKGTNNLLDCAPKCKFIFMSTVVVYSKDELDYLARESSETNPESIYGMTKLAGENLVNFYHKSDKIQGINLRLCATVGPGLTHGIIKAFIRKIKANPTLQVIGKEPGACKPFIHIDDVIRVIKHYIENDYKESQTTNVCTLRPLNVEEVAVAVMNGLSINKEIVWGEDTWIGDNGLIKCDNTKMRNLGIIPQYKSYDAILKAVGENL